MLDQNICCNFKKLKINNYKSDLYGRPQRVQQSQNSLTTFTCLMKQKTLQKSKRKRDKGRLENPKETQKIPNQNDKIVDLNCPIQDECSGCNIQHNITQPPIYFEAKQLFNSYGIKDYELIVDKTQGWRYRAKLAVRGSSKNPRIGLFKEGTHQVVDMREGCQMHHPKINQAISNIYQLIIQFKIQPYNEQRSGGLLRYLQLTVTTKQNSSQRNQIELVLVVNLNPKEYNKQYQLLYFIESLWNYRKGQFSSIWLNYQNENTNSIFGKEWKLEKGEKFSVQRFLGVNVWFHPGSFQQANVKTMNLAIKEICKYIPSQSTILEMHAGAGVIGLCAATHCSPKSVCFVESNNSNSEGFNLSKRIVQKDVDLKYMVQDVNLNSQELVDGMNIVIVDPPRKGLEEGLLKVLVDPVYEQQREQLQKLIYLSCGFSSLKRDLVQLLQYDRWKIRKCVSYLFFPGTNSIETLVILDYVKR
eukprot:TRINITY_DN1594_c1_g1_i5.p1 TRINITY_DN1594_c1_g1~~TRINITY_DN1594_c1_g1_i5.p1  ORF type:complete len:473 (-),score=34.35 TRINITY_DN1594_c1_g1_i5:548-1966(-)